MAGSGVSWAAGSSGSSSSSGFSRVGSYLELPAPDTVADTIIVVENAEGEGVNEKPAGLWLSDGIEWKWLGDSTILASQVSFTQTGDLISEDVDGAIAELVEKILANSTAITVETAARIAAAGAHSHAISAVTGLQDALDGKAATAHAHAITSVTGLQGALDGKAPAAHIHSPQDVSGLSESLLGKAAAIHGHVIDDVTGLQGALDGKAPTAHSHATSDITGFTDALNTRAPTAHTHGIADTTGLQGALDGKAETAHSHTIGNVTGLQGALDGKAVTVHGHTITDITGLRDELDAIINTPAGAHSHVIEDVTGLQGALDGKAATAHGHAISDTTGLQTALDGKASSTHGHAISTIIGLQGELDGKALAAHTHAISDTTGLQTALDGKAGAAHGHIIASITGLQGELDGKAATGHGHAISNITGLQGELDGKALSGHSHVISDIVGLQAELDGKALTSHAHTIANVTGLQGELDAKSNTGHGHTISDTTGLQGALDAKSPIGHVHEIANVTGLQDALDAASGGGGTPGGSTKQIQFNDAGVFAGDDSFTWDKDNNDLYIGGLNPVILLGGITAEPSAPLANMLSIYSKSVASRMVPKIKGPNGLDTPLQNAFWQNNIVMWNPTVATAGIWLGTAGSGAGTFSNSLPNINTVYSGIKHARWANVVTTPNQVLGQRNTEAMFGRGAIANQGGFFFFARGGTDVWTNGGRFFTGFHSATTVVSADPSLLNNTMGFCVDAADNGAISFMTRGTALTKVATGLTLANNVGFDFYMFAPPNGSAIGWRIVNLNTLAEASGVATTNLPANTSFFTVGLLASNAALTAATSVQVGLNRIYVETDY